MSTVTERFTATVPSTAAASDSDQTVAESHVAGTVTAATTPQRRQSRAPTPRRAR
jgi:hypothetical protein